MNGLTTPRTETASLSVPPPLPRKKTGYKSHMLNNIGEALQAHYNELVTAPLPDKFEKLLAELEAKEQKS